MGQMSQLLVGGDIKDKQIIFKDGLIENSKVLKMREAKVLQLNTFNS